MCLTEQTVPIGTAIFSGECACRWPPSLAADRAEKAKGGLSTRIAETEFTNGQPVRMLDDSESLIAIGFYEESEKSVRPKVVLV